MQLTKDARNGKIAGKVQQRIIYIDFFLLAIFVSMFFLITPVPQLLELQLCRGEYSVDSIYRTSIMVRIDYFSKSDIILLSKNTQT